MKNLESMEYQLHAVSFSIRLMAEAHWPQGFIGYGFKARRIHFGLDANVF